MSDTAPATREARDSLGAVTVPADALYGPQTARAVVNFPVSGWPMPAPFVAALARLKRAAAKVNLDLGRLDAPRAALIARAADEVIEGRHAAHFPVDVFQTGSGTSSNMNMNEVLARRAQQLAAGPESVDVHPNDHVNLGQSSNDIVPTAVHVACALELRNDLLPALGVLRAALDAKKTAFDGIVKIGRTHLQDATPIRLGQVFSGYSGQVRDAIRRIAEVAAADLRPVALGGTAVGTGLNAHPAFARKTLAFLTQETGIAFREAENHFSAQAAAGGMVRLAGELKGLAVALTKIANDIRFLASGPRCGLGELRLASLQPGSSIMPGKVNPVACESLMQVAAYVAGAETTVSFAAATLSNFELSTAWPVIAHAALESIRLLAASARNFSQSAVDGLAADEKRCADLCEQSLAMVTSLAPRLGYDRAAELAKKASASGRTVRDVAAELGLIPADELERLLDPERMTRPDGKE